MALGSYPEVSLAQARKKTVEARELLARGIDPKAQRNELQEAKRAETEHTFENMAALRPDELPELPDSSPIEGYGASQVAGANHSCTGALRKINTAINSTPINRCSLT